MMSKREGLLAAKILAAEAVEELKTEANQAHEDRDYAEEQRLRNMCAGAFKVYQALDEAGKKLFKK